MLWPASLQNDLASQPATFQDQEGDGGKLTNIFAQKTGRPFRGKNRKTQTGLLFRTGNQVALDLALLIQGEEVFFQSQEKILCFPGSQGRIDFQTGKRRPLAGCFTDSGEFLLEPRFGVSERQRIQSANIGTHEWFAKQIDSMRRGDIPLPEEAGSRLVGGTISKL